MSQIYTPSFGDEEFDFSDNTTDHNVNSRRMRSMVVSDYEQQAALNSSIDDDIDCHINDDSNASLVAAVSNKQETFSNNTLTEPIKPFSGYGFFFRDTVSAIKQQNPTCSFQEITTIVASMWEALDEAQKQQYNNKHEIAKQEYIKALRLYKQQQQQLQQQQKQQQQLHYEAENQSTPQQQQQQTQLNAIFLNNQPIMPEKPTTQEQSIQAQQQQQQQQLLVTNTNTNVNLNDEESDIKPNITTPSASLMAPPPPQQQIQLLTEAAATQKCTRVNCNKPAIINPDWEDEYCSNECVVIHCRNVFNEWVSSSKLNNPTTNATTSTS